MFNRFKNYAKEGNFIVPLLSILRFVLVILVVGFSYGVYQQQRTSEVDQYRYLEEERLAFLKSNMEDISDLVAGDLELAKSHHEFLDYLLEKAEQGEDHRENLIEELQVLSSQRKIYDQIRFIDVNGNEDIRINYRAGLTYSTPEEELQNKSDRYYFQETIKLSDGEVYISPLDLNIEGGEIEQPLKPMIRISTPIFIEGELKGILILNYLAQELLDSLSNNINLEGEEVFLINQDGYWLQGPSKEDEWGFMYDDSSKTIFNWDNTFDSSILEENKHQGLHADGLFTTATVKPFDQLDYQWKLVSFLPNVSLYKESEKLLNYLIITNIVIVSLLITASSVLIFAFKKRIAADKIITKLNDTLKIITKVLRHDLANDFTHIKFSLELFRENNKEKEFLKEVDFATEHGISIIGQMKEIEGMVSQGAKLKKFEVQKTIKKLFEKYSIEFKIQGDAIIKVDDGINSVFDNIISNAVRHGKTDRMDIKITQGKKKVIVKFADFGKGVPDEIKKFIFDEGFKHGKTGNTGLGLYIVAKTVERYGGKIWVEDNKPKGAVFVLEFPITN
ncbi:MAG: sensor histidine kinase [Candidatus Pacebacteria bacterium]|nr:sensor histidine kinase [Candidatus Paceibacterota bacterium]